MIDPPPEWREFEKRARRGLIWRTGFILADLAVLGWLSTSLNAMRLYTISQAPNYVPTEVIQYWLASGVTLHG